MSWWKQRDQSTADPAAEPGSPAVDLIAPVDVEILAGKLAAHVYVHEIASLHEAIPCWSYVSDGLAAHRQTELVFTLRREPDEPVDAFPEDPLRLFASIQEIAEDGQRITSGSFTEFGGNGFFGHHLLYVKALPLPGVTLPVRCLAALQVTSDELRAARAFGTTRVLARLGQASFHYPFPPWADRRRRGLSLARTFETSVLSKISSMSAHDVHVGMQDNQITVSVLRAEQASWPARLAAVPPDVPVALFPAFDPVADGCLTWVPGQKAPEAIIPPGSDGSRLCGCFLAFVAEQPANSGKLLEDGFAMQLTSESWQAIRGALVEGKELSIPASDDGMSLALTWRDEVYVSPIDPTAYAAEGDQTHLPIPAGARPADPAKAGELRFLTSETEIAARTSPDALEAFCRAIMSCTERTLGDCHDELAIVMRLECTPQGHGVQLSGRGDAPPEMIDALFEAIKQLPSLPVREGEVVFEVALTISAGPRAPSPG
jgi:hypothetical protein